MTLRPTPVMDKVSLEAAIEQTIPYVNYHKHDHYSNLT